MKVLIKCQFVVKLELSTYLLVPHVLLLTKEQVESTHKDYAIQSRPCEKKVALDNQLLFRGLLSQFIVLVCKMKTSQGLKNIDTVSDCNQSTDHNLQSLCNPVQLH